MHRVVGLIFVLVAVSCQSAPQSRDTGGGAAEPVYGEELGYGQAQWVEEAAATRLGLNPEEYTAAGLATGAGDLYLTVSTHTMNPESTAPLEVQLVLVRDGKTTAVISGFEQVFGASESVYDELGHCEEAFAAARWREVSGRWFMSFELSCRAGDDVISTNTVAAFYVGIGSLPGPPQRVWTGRVSGVESTYGECVLTWDTTFALTGGTLTQVVTAVASFDAEESEDAYMAREECVVVETDRVATQRFELPVPARLASPDH